MSDASYFLFSPKYAGQTYTSCSENPARLVYANQKISTCFFGMALETRYYFQTNRKKQSHTSSSSYAREKEGNETIAKITIPK